MVVCLYLWWFVCILCFSVPEGEVSYIAQQGSEAGGDPHNLVLESACKVIWCVFVLHHLVGYV